MKRIIIVLCIVVFAIISLTGCNNSEVKLKAEEAISAFENDDLQAINQLIFNTNPITDSVKNDDETKKSNSIIEHILPKVELSIRSSTDSNVVFEISAPDMSGVFESYKGDISELDSDKIYDFIVQYSDNAKTKSFVVELPVIKKEDSIIIEYQNKDFINAVTGGLLNEYSTLYNNILDQYSQGVELK